MRIILILTLILASNVVNCNTSGEEEVIIIPSLYTGYIIVIFDQKDGVPIKYEGKKRVYKIPQSGILKTQFKINQGWRRFPQFYYEKILPKNELQSFAEFQKIPLDKVVGLIGSNWTVKRKSDSDDRIEFCEFYVGTKLNIEKTQEQVEKLDIIKLCE